MKMPFNLYNPIFIRLNLFIGFPDYEGDSMEEILRSSSQVYYLKNDKNTHLSVSFMYSTVSFVNELFSFYSSNIDEFIEATKGIREDKSMIDSEEYWLFSWHPNRVLETDLLVDQLEETKKMWMNETEKLQKALYSLIFQKPFGDNENYFDWLRGR